MEILSITSLLWVIFTSSLWVTVSCHNTKSKTSYPIRPVSCCSHDHCKELQVHDSCVTLNGLGHLQYCCPAPILSTNYGNSITLLFMKTLSWVKKDPSTESCWNFLIILSFFDMILSIIPHHAHITILGIGKEGWLWSGFKIIYIYHPKSSPNHLQIPWAF